MAFLLLASKCAQSQTGTRSGYACPVGVQLCSPTPGSSAPFRENSAPGVAQEPPFQPGTLMPLYPRENPGHPNSGSRALFHKQEPKTFSLGIELGSGWRKRRFPVIRSYHSFLTHTGSQTPSYTRHAPSNTQNISTDRQTDKDAGSAAHTRQLYQFHLQSNRT